MKEVFISQGAVMTFSGVVNRFIFELFKKSVSEVILNHSVYIVYGYLYYVLDSVSAV